MDVDNIYRFGDQESANKNDTNVFSHTFQRGPNESVRRTIPQPEWEIEQYANPSGSSQQLFTHDQSDENENNTSNNSNNNNNNKNQNNSNNM